MTAKPAGNQKWSLFAMFALLQNPSHRPSRTLLFLIFLKISILPIPPPQLTMMRLHVETSLHPDGGRLLSPEYLQLFKKIILPR